MRYFPACCYRQEVYWVGDFLKTVISVVIAVMLLFTVCAADDGSGNDNSGFFSSVLDWFGDFFSNLGEAIYDLFVPSSADIKAVNNKLQSTVEKKFGAVFDIYDVTNKKINALKSKSFTMKKEFNIKLTGVESTKFDLFGGLLGNSDMADFIKILKFAISDIMIIFTSIFCYKKFVEAFGGG